MMLRYLIFLRKTQVNSKNATAGSNVIGVNLGPRIYCCSVCVPTECEFIADIQINALKKSTHFKFYPISLAWTKTNRLGIKRAHNSNEY